MPYWTACGYGAYAYDLIEYNGCLPGRLLIVGDSLTLEDSFNRLVTFVREFFDSLTIEDSGVALNFAVKLNDLIALIDSFTTNVAIQRTDSLLIIDTDIKYSLLYQIIQLLNINDNFDGAVNRILAEVLTIEQDISFIVEKIFLENLNILCEVFPGELDLARLCWFARDYFLFELTPEDARSYFKLNVLGRRDDGKFS